jgi:hypothetical protein
MKASSAHLSVFLAVVLWLGGCGSGTSITEVTVPPPPDPGTDPDTADPPPADPTPISEITDATAVLLTRSMMAMIGRLATIGEIASDMIDTGADLLSGPYESTMAIPQCANSPAGTGTSVNELRFWRIIGSNFDLPPGDALTAAFSDCTIAGFQVSGFLHIAGIVVSGDPSGSNDWDINATVAMSPFQFDNGNDTLTTFTDDFRYSKVKAGGVHTVNLEVAKEPDAGFMGGLNAQHHLTPVMNNQYAINYQFRPFRITMIQNDNIGDYRIMIQAHSSDGASILNRYTVSPPSNIKLVAATTVSNPITWTDGRPADYIDVPATGEVELVDSDRSILVTIESNGVLLTIDLGSSVIIESIGWEELLSAPES